MITTTPAGLPAVMKAINAKIEAAILQAERASAAETVTMLQRRTPVQTGEMKHAWQSTTAPRGARTFNTSGHAVFVEKRQKVMSGAVSEMRSILITNLKKHVKGAVK